MKISSHSGQTLIEIVAAIALIMIVVTALIGMGLVALKTANSGRNQVVGDKLASEEMELVRACRDKSGGYATLYASLGSCGSSNCYIDSNLNIVNSTDTTVPAISGVSFQRNFRLTAISASELRVVATVTWTDSRGTHTSSVTSYLTNWR